MQICRRAVALRLSFATSDLALFAIENTGLVRRFGCHMLAAIHVSRPFKKNRRSPREAYEPFAERRKGTFPSRTTAIGRVNVDARRSENRRTRRSRKSTENSRIRARFRKTMAHAKWHLDRYLRAPELAVFAKC